MGVLELNVNCGLVDELPTDTSYTNQQTEQVNSLAIAMKIIVTEPTKIIGMGWNCYNATEDVDFNMGIYSDDSGTPDTLLYATGNHPKGTTAGWKRVDANYTLQAGTYWIAVQLDETIETTNIFQNNSSSTGANISIDDWLSFLPTNWSELDNDDKLVAIYALTPKVETGGAGTKAIATRYPVEKGLIAGTTKQTGNKIQLEPSGKLGIKTNVRSIERVGF